MSSKKKVILALIIIISLFLVLYFFLSHRKQIPQNPIGTVGNTAGNLNNGGYFCEQDGKVYFSNAYDNGALYCMNVDETEIKRLNGSEASYLNVAGNYIYYYQKNASGHSDLGYIFRTFGLYRCKTNGQDPVCLDRSDCGAVTLVDNTLFYTKSVEGQKTLHLFSISTDKRNTEQIAEYLANPASAANSVLYYNGTQKDHYLYTYDTMTKQETLLKEYPMWFPTLHGNSIFFLDLESNYQLCRYDLYDDSMTVIATDRVDAFNVTDQYVYYQTSGTETPALMRVNSDGTNPEVVAEGVFSDISVTSHYVYFRPFGAEHTMYHTPANGPISVSTFDGASQAALKEMQK